MGGLGYLEVMDDGSFKGPIDKFIPEELKGEFRSLAKLEAGDTIFFMADKEGRAAYFAGMVRTELGEKLDLLEKMHSASVMSMISLCLSATPKQKN